MKLMHVDVGFKFATVCSVKRLIETQFESKSFSSAQFPFTLAGNFPFVNRPLID